MLVFFKNEDTNYKAIISLDSHYQVLEQKQIQLCLLPNNQLCDTEIPHNWIIYNYFSLTKLKL